MPTWGRKLVTQIVEIISVWLERFWIDGFEVQLSHGNRHAHVTLSVKKQERKSSLELANSLLERIANLDGVSIPSKKQVIGKSYLLHNINKRSFFSQYTAFFQSNIRLTPRLVNEVKQKCANIDFYRILDLYCGVGLFSLSIAGGSTPVIGVDINKRAIDSARLNAKNLGLSLVSFVCSPVENYLQNASISPHDFVIFDPPRTGCPQSLISIISKRKSSNICSISCNPHTQIRDLKKWIGNGYSVQSIAALDMFPFTEFLETVVFLHRKE
jgi:23S rRNA (uracil1939-C5)-methyltransferase